MRKSTVFSSRTMPPLLYKDAFWNFPNCVFSIQGSDFTCHAGYDTVIQRLRDGREMCKDMEELLKMRALAEEKYGKDLVTIARKAGGNTEISTLKASFEILKTQIENIGTFHIQLSDLLKEEVKKIETFRERQKEQRKKFQSIMEKVQKKKVAIYKRTMESKKTYEVRCREADEAEHGAEKITVASKNSEKVFQQLEGDRISMLRCALWDHCNHFSMQCVKDDEFYEEVRKLLESCDITTDNNYFIGMRSTGSRPPEPIFFESYYQTQKSGDSNGQAHFAGGGGEEDMMMRCSDPLLGSSVNIRFDNLENPHSAPAPFSGAVESDGGYAELPGLLGAASLPTVSADDDTCYIALHEYVAKEEDELSVSRGELIRVLEQGEDGWWTAEKNGKTGLVPGNYLGKS
ncbi:hypothetical protein F7725_026090 [Dissostichus mawsoni]|uniref:Proline-serine-threonine phosphatase interacting protein 1 n=1 Tax=Dissostichus mawsoni TaxID=36200 RepID=A0A7J5X675_DISMA|nr:hypothetical protein F7725_026090 [Dissostichus mawsoni]